MTDQPSEPRNPWSLLDDDDSHYTIIGRTASNWAILETMIDGVIADLANCGEAEMVCVTAQLIGPARRMDALIALFKFQGGSDALRRKLKAFQGKIQQLGEDRNRVVHDPIFKRKETGQIHKILATAKGELKYEFTPVSAVEMNKIADNIRNAGWEFMDLKKEIQAEMSDILAQRLKRIGVALGGQNPPSENPSGSAQ